MVPGNRATSLAIQDHRPLIASRHRLLLQQVIRQPPKIAHSGGHGCTEIREGADRSGQEPFLAARQVLKQRRLVWPFAGGYSGQPAQTIVEVPLQAPLGKTEVIFITIHLAKARCGPAADVNGFPGAGFVLEKLGLRTASTRLFAVPGRVRSFQRRRSNTNAIQPRAWLDARGGCFVEGRREKVRHPSSWQRLLFQWHRVVGEVLGRLATLRAAMPKGTKMLPWTDLGAEVATDNRLK